MNKSIKIAQALGEEFAEYLNNHPDDAQNWSSLERSDDLPEFDYAELRDRCGDVTHEMEDAYRDVFNSVFIPANKSTGTDNEAGT